MAEMNWLGTVDQRGMVGVMDSLHTVSLCTVKQCVEKVHAICHGCDGLTLNTVSLCTVKQCVEKVRAICRGCDGLSLHTVSLCTVKQCPESPSHPLSCHPPLHLINLCMLSAVCVQPTVASWVFCSMTIVDVSYQ